MHLGMAGGLRILELKREHGVAHALGLRAAHDEQGNRLLPGQSRQARPRCCEVRSTYPWLYVFRLRLPRSLLESWLPVFGPLSFGRLP